MSKKRALLNDLSMRAEACLRCPLNKTRKSPVSGSGNPRSPIMVVGDIPRQSNDNSGKPFSGRAESRLHRMLRSADINPDQVYYTIAVRCYPGRDNHYPSAKAADRCREYLRAELKIVRPRAVILCGLDTLKWTLIRKSSERVDDSSFIKWVGPAIRFRQMWGDLKFFAIHSPVSLVKSRDVDGEKKSIETLKLIKEMVRRVQIKDPMAVDTIDLLTPKVRADQKKFEW